MKKQPKRNSKVIFLHDGVEKAGTIIQLSMNGESFAVECGYPKNKIIIQPKDIIKVK